MANNQKGLSYAVVEVELSDINNQRPRWPFTSEMVACPENSVIGVKCATILAPDADFEINTVSIYNALATNPNFEITASGLLIPLVVSVVFSFVN